MKYINLSVPKPCHENWESFEKTAQGGYCSNCRKEVVDFTKMSDEQIIQFLTRTKSGGCGRFRRDQLGDYSVDDMRKLPSLSWLSASMLTLLSIFVSSLQTKAETKEFLASEIVCDMTPSTKNSRHAVDSLPGKVVTGIVVDELSNPVRGCIILLKGTKLGMMSDNDGRFRFAISNPSEKDTLIFSFLGYITKRIAVPVDTEITVILEIDYRMPLEMFTVGYYPMRSAWHRQLWRRFKSLFSRKYS